MSNAQLRPNKGNQSTEEDALIYVVGRLVEKLDPESIWLFGSRSRGDHRVDSDFDLLVVTSIDSPASEEDYERVYAPLVGSLIGVDVVPCRVDDLNMHVARGNGMVYDIVTKGTLLYDRSKQGQGVESA